jgi:hypothetical protein
MFAKHRHLVSRTHKEPSKANNNKIEKSTIRFFLSGSPYVAQGAEPDLEF